MQMQRFLITSCSQRKKTSENLLPAIERYDGPNFRLLRKYLSQANDKLDVCILSAKFGLLSCTTEIPFYEQKLTNQKVQELIKLSVSQADHFFTEAKKTKEIFVNLGKDYLQVFQSTLKKIAQNNSLIFTSGSSGKRLAEMHNWLYGENSPLRNEQAETKSDKVFIQGVWLKANEKKIREVVQNELALNGTSSLQNYQSWFVSINGLKVSPKWLISKLTGLPVGKFHSDQARKVLQKLGIKVERV